jgi:hypothetical protein
VGSVTAYDALTGRRYRVLYRLPDNSQTDKRGFKTKREAELFLANVDVAKSRGEFVSASQARITVGEWAEQWLATQVQLTHPQSTSSLSYAAPTGTSSCSSPTRASGGARWPRCA